MREWYPDAEGLDELFDEAESLIDGRTSDLPTFYQRSAGT